MKASKILFFACFMLLLCNIAAARQTIVSNANDLRIDLVRYDPSPVQPGSEIEMWFEITNLDKETRTNLELMLVEDYPFTIISDNTVVIEELSPNEKKEFNYKVKVNPDAIEGSYNLGLQFYSAKAKTTISEPFSISVMKKGSLLSTTVDVETDNIKQTFIEPGHSAIVKFKVQNYGESVMNDVIINLELTASTVPFAPSGMTTEQKVKSIAAGSEKEVAFTLIALPNAASGVYKIPINIKYYNEQGNLYNETSIVGLVIGSAPKISVELESTDLNTNAKAGKAVLKVINYGNIDLKFVRIAIEKGEGYEIISTDKAYIGDVDSDDYDTAEFRVKMLNDEADLKVSLDYKDANNNAYTEEQAVHIKLYSPSELGIKASRSWIWFMLIVIAAGSYIAYRRFKRRKHLAKQ